jgi:SAM-dependent methyltransferase
MRRRSNDVADLRYPERAPLTPASPVVSDDFGSAEGCLDVAMPIFDPVLAAVARQLGHPSGPVGRVTGRLLNRGNRGLITAAVDAAQVEPGATAVDVGFGGGAGLSLLLDRVGPDGVVYGAEISATMLARARRIFAADCASGRLRLHEASLARLPLPDATADVIVSTNTIYFVDDLEAAFRELARALRPGGVLVLGIGDPGAMAEMPFTKHGFQLRSIVQIRAALAAAGFAHTNDRRLSDDETSPHVVVARTGKRLP